jgi:predicted RNA polymerase sigma factor
VLEVVYLIFNEGYTATRGQDWLRPQLCNEALRMGRVLTAIAPHEPESHGLLALMELNASRTAARTDGVGEPILMLDQNRALWDQLQIRRGMQALERARKLGGAGGIYALQAAIIACHAQARTAGDTDWSRIAGLYAELAAVGRSPIIDLNRAVAVGMAEGPEGVTTRKCSECTTSWTKHERAARWYVRCTLDGCRSGDGRRHVSDVPEADLSPSCRGALGQLLSHQRGKQIVERK